MNEKQEIEKLKAQLKAKDSKITKLSADLTKATTKRARARSYIKKVMSKKQNSNSTSELHISVNSDICECLERNKDSERAKAFIDEITEEVVYIKFEKVKEFKTLCRDLIINYFEEITIKEV